MIPLLLLFDRRNWRPDVFPYVLLLTLLLVAGMYLVGKLLTTWWSQKRLANCTRFRLDFQRSDFDVIEWTLLSTLLPDQGASLTEGNENTTKTFVFDARLRTDIEAMLTKRGWKYELSCQN